MNRAASVGGGATKEIQSVVTGGLPTEDILRQLDSWGVDWYVTEGGDLMMKYWQVGAENFVPPEHVATIRAGRAVPNETRALEWVSRHLAELRQLFGGRWVAVVGNAVAASAPTLPQLLQQVQELGIERPFVTEIPTGQVTWNMT